MKKLSQLLIRILLPVLLLLPALFARGQSHNTKRINNRLYNDSASKRTIDSIYNLLEGGADFNELATMYSQDESSYQRGGKLDYTPADNYVAEYRDTLLSLTLNKLSRPFKTAFGYHIVQLIDKRNDLYFSQHILIRVNGKKRHESTVSRNLSEIDLRYIKKIDTSLGYDNFYKKCIYANGIPILSSDNVSDQALIQAKAITEHIANSLPRGVVKTMTDRKFRIVVTSKTEKTTSVPEYSNLYKIHPKGNWDNVGGVGGTPEIPISTCSEENLLCYQNDISAGYDILTHELAHGIHALGLNFYDRKFDKKLLKMWKMAKKEKLWTETYAVTNHYEYFACATQIWFHVFAQSPIANGFSNSIDTRKELLTYDPRLYKLMQGVYSASILNISCSCKK